MVKKKEKTRVFKKLLLFLLVAILGVGLGACRNDGRNSKKVAIAIKKGFDGVPSAEEEEAK